MTQNTGLGLCEHPGDGRPEPEQPGRRQQDEPSLHRVHARARKPRDLPMIARLKVVGPCNENRQVATAEVVSIDPVPVFPVTSARAMPTQQANADLRSREYLTPAEIEKLIKAGRQAPLSQGLFAVVSAAKMLRRPKERAFLEEGRTHQRRETRNVRYRHASGCRFGRACPACCFEQRRACAKEIRHGRHRHRDQDREHYALFGTCFRLWRDRKVPAGLFRQDQRRRRHQREKNQLHLL